MPPLDPDPGLETSTPTPTLVFHSSTPGQPSDRPSTLFLPSIYLFLTTLHNHTEARALIRRDTTTLLSHRHRPCRACRPSACPQLSPPARPLRRPLAPARRNHTAACPGTGTKARRTRTRQTTTASPLPYRQKFVREVRAATASSRDHHHQYTPRTRSIPSTRISPSTASMDRRLRPAQARASLRANSATRLHRYRRSSRMHRRMQTSTTSAHQRTTPGACEGRVRQDRAWTLCRSTTRAEMRRWPGSQMTGTG